MSNAPKATNAGEQNGQPNRYKERGKATHTRAKRLRNTGRKHKAAK